MPQFNSPLLGGFYESRSLVLSSQRCVNLYPEMVETKDGKEPGALYGCPGLVARYAHGTEGQWRELMSSVTGPLYGIVGSAFVQINGKYEVNVIGSLNSDKGRVMMVESASQMLMTDGRYAYGYDMMTGRFAVITVPFTGTGPSACAYQDGVFVMNDTGTQQWWQSDVGDVFTWGAANFSSKDGGPDPLVSIVDHHREMWLFGSETTEVWVNQGNPGFQFARLDGVFFQVGCAAVHSAACCEDRVVWLSKTMDGVGQVMMAKGYQLTRISTHAIEREFQSYPTMADAFAYFYQQEGHRFYVITFPSGDATWVYDLDVGLWHERASFVNGHFHRHRMNCLAAHHGKIVVGDYSNGLLYELDLDTYDDNGEPRKWLRSFAAQPSGRIDLRSNFHWRGQLYMEPGVGRLGCSTPVRALKSPYDAIRTLDDGQNIRILSGIKDVNCEEPQIMLRFSDDGGLSWSNEFWRTPGKIGQTKWRVIWNRLGQSRDRVYEVSATDPFKPALLAFMIEVEPGLD